MFFIPEPPDQAPPPRGPGQTPNALAWLLAGALLLYVLRA